ncbi:hypothetical protein MTP99_018744 [Tenebrio molitor]|jgi:hypothetical protein|nr:hypothetical protein MTP99_018744 [Tenebrio molitor]
MKTTRRSVEDAMKKNRKDRVLLGGDFKGRIGERGWEILNGNRQGYEEGEWTYNGSMGKTVIDYGILNEEAWEKVEEFRTGERTETDYLEIALRKQRGGK